MNHIKAEDIKTFPQLKTMCDMAWEARSNARLTSTGKTRVGAVVLSDEEAVVGESIMNMFGGCNVEHRFRSHDIHAEVNAISSLVVSGITTFHTILIVAARDKFTPCGSCMDWIMEIGGPKTKIMFQSDSNSDICVYTAEELMPHYPF